MATAVAETTEPTRVVDVRYVPLAVLQEHPLNPRKHFDPAFLRELAESVRAKGVLTPLLVRPAPADIHTSKRVLRGDVAPQFQVLAGHQRLRASRLAELAEVPVIVRELDDAAALELMIIDNLQRQDVHALDEASGYQELMRTGYDVARIAERVGRSVKYVYDRVKLLQLVPELQEAFLEGRITAGHAILLARLDAKDQEWTNQDGALWQHQGYLALERDDDIRGELDPVQARKACSVRELAGWIGHHLRLDVAMPEEDLQMQFPELATALAEDPVKVIHITHEHALDESRKGDQKTFVSGAWKRADDKRGAKPCPHAVLGVIVVGRGRGQAFNVCNAKEKCKVHWGAEIKERERRAKEAAARPASSASASPARDSQDSYAEKARRDEEKRKAEAARWERATPAILAAVVERVKKLPAGSMGVLGEIVVDAFLDQTGHYVDGKTKSPMPRGKTAEDLVRYLAYELLAGEVADGGYHYSGRPFEDTAKKLGIDLKKLLAAADKGTSAAPAKPAKKGRKRA
jgi:ParB/RepB/Spo0J family partition protein